MRGEARAGGAHAQQLEVPQQPTTPTTASAQHHQYRCQTPVSPGPSWEEAPHAYAYYMRRPSTATTCCPRCLPPSTCRATAPSPPHPPRPGAPCAYVQMPRGSAAVTQCCAASWPRGTGREAAAHRYTASPAILPSALGPPPSSSDHTIVGDQARNGTPGRARYCTLHTALARVGGAPYPPPWARHAPPRRGRPERWLLFGCDLFVAQLYTRMGKELAEPGRARPARSGLLASSSGSLPLAGLKRGSNYMGSAGWELQPHAAGGCNPRPAHAGRLLSNQGRRMIVC